MTKEATATAMVPRQFPDEAPLPAQLVAAALERGVDPGVMSQMLALQERWEAGQARKAFVKAMAAFKAECPAVLPKNKHVYFESKKPGVPPTDYWHTTLDKVVETVQPLLAKHGLHHEWRTGFAERRVEVTCRLSHVAGHFEETSLSGEPDTSGGKNPVQTVGSTTTYLMRYTLLALLGLATAEQDDDGRGGHPTPERTQQRPRDPAAKSSDEPSAVCLEHIKACGAAARGYSGEVAAKMARAADDAFARLAQGHLSARYAGTLLGNLKAGLTRLGWQEPAEWGEERKERRAAAKKQELADATAPEDDPQEPPDPRDVAGLDELSERVPGEEG